MKIAVEGKILVELGVNNGNIDPANIGGAKGCSYHRFHAPPAYTAQLLTLHQHRANNQYRKAN